MNQIQQPNFFQMNDMMNNMNLNMNNFNEPLGINIINNNNIKEDSDESKINIIFETNRGLQTSIFINNLKTINELLNMYIKKIGQNDEYLHNAKFLYNSREINPEESKNILEYGIKNRELLL